MIQDLEIAEYMIVKGYQVSIEEEEAKNLIDTLKDQGYEREKNLMVFTSSGYVHIKRRG